MANENEIHRHEFSSREDWLALRKSLEDKLGGSELGVAAGHSSYDSGYSLLCKKLGAIPEKDISREEAIVQGHDLEPYVADRFSRIAGKDVYEDTCIFTNDSFPHLKATPDRLMKFEDSGLECKTAKPEAWRKNEDGDFPLTYFDQCMCYLAVTGRQRWYLAAMVSGTDFKTFLCTRDESEVVRYNDFKSRFKAITDSIRNFHCMNREDRLSALPTFDVSSLTDIDKVDFMDWVGNWCYLEGVYHVDEESLAACEEVAKRFIGRKEVVEQYISEKTYKSEDERLADLRSAISQVWPQDEIDSSDATSNAIYEMFPNAVDGTAVALDGVSTIGSDGNAGKTYAELLEERAKAKKEIEEREELISSIENILAMKIGNCEKMTLSGWSISYKEAKSRRLDKSIVEQKFGGTIPDDCFTETSYRKWYIRQKKNK